MVGHTPESHRKIRLKQSQNHNDHHHPKEKIQQLNKFKDRLINKNILEVFAGQGNLTKFYNGLGKVTPMTREKFGSSFDYIYQVRADSKRWDVIDIDSYGYPDLFFPIVFELMENECLLIFTFPVVGVNCLNGIQEQHFINFWRSSRPTVGDVAGIVTDLGLRYWILCSLADVVKIKRIWRFVFSCKKTKATEFCNVRNR